MPGEGTTLRGYKKRPLAIALIALGFLLVPMVGAAGLFLQAEGAWPLMKPLLTSRYFLQEWILSWSAAVAVYVVSKASFAYFLLLSGYVLTTRFMHLATHPTLETPLSLGITTFWFAVVIYFLLSELKTPYLNPRLRWWTRPRRVSLSCAATLFYQGAKIPATVLNLSEGGVFLKLNEPVAQGQPFPQRLGEEFQLEMVLTPSKSSKRNLAMLGLRGQLVWKAASASLYRYGMGIRFLAISGQEKRLLRDYLRDEG